MDIGNFFNQEICCCYIYYYHFIINTLIYIFLFYIGKFAEVCQKINCLARFQKLKPLQSARVALGYLFCCNELRA